MLQSPVTRREAAAQRRKRKRRRFFGRFLCIVLLGAGCIFAARPFSEPLADKLLSADGTVYFSQNDSRWKNTAYGKTGTIGKSGCGPACIAMIVSSGGNKKADPAEVSKWAQENGQYCDGIGRYHSLVPEGGEKYGFNVKGAEENPKKQIISALKSGKRVIALMGKGHFTSGGHYILLRGISENGKFLFPIRPAVYAPYKNGILI